jgi:hypothetical protein
MKRSFGLWAFVLLFSCADLRATVGGSRGFVLGNAGQVIRAPRQGQNPAPRALTPPLPHRNRFGR